MSGFGFVPILGDTKVATMLQPQTTGRGMRAPTFNDFAALGASQQPPKPKSGAAQINPGGALVDEEKQVHLKGGEEPEVALPIAEPQAVPQS